MLKHKTKMFEKFSSLNLKRARTLRKKIVICVAEQHLAIMQFALETTKRPLKRDTASPKCF